MPQTQGKGGLILGIWRRRRPWGSYKERRGGPGTLLRASPTAPSTAPTLIPSAVISIRRLSALGKLVPVPASVPSWRKKNDWIRRRGLRPGSVRGRPEKQHWVVITSWTGWESGADCRGPWGADLSAALLSLFHRAWHLSATHGSTADPSQRTVCSGWSLILTFQEQTE